MTTQACLRAEDALLEAGVEVTVVPKPPSLVGLCGIALEVEDELSEQATSILTEEDIPFDVYA